MTRWWIGSVVCLLACGDDPVEPECAANLQLEAWVDGDGDGAGDPDTAAQVCVLAEGLVTNGDDCDDADPAISPFLDEICDGVDQDCDGAVDNGLPTSIFYADADGDGQGDPDAGSESCERPAASSPDGTDCDDTQPDVFVGAPEVCDGIDNNCDGTVDDEDPALDASTGTWFYPDDDSDGYGDESSAFQACENPNPGLVIAEGGDCDDTDGERFPTQVEICDGIDNNCDGLTDGADPLLDLSTTDTFYPDVDNDGIGDETQPIQGCFVQPDQSAIPGDCDDGDPAQGLAPRWVNDLDGDGFGAGAPVGPPVCDQPLPNTVPEGGEVDCDDSEPAFYPGGVEICDRGDNDCDDLIDDDDPSVDLVDGELYYLDLDGDGAGAGVPELACHNPDQQLYTLQDGDCDDSDALIAPGGDEVCDAVDNDCDDLIDDEDPSLDPSTRTPHFEDLDDDGIGSAVGILACGPGPGVSDIPGDCDDSDPAVGEPWLWVADADGDTYGAGPVLGPESCTPPQADAVPEGPAVDCLDADPAVYPGAPELCADGIDSDCDGLDCASWIEDFEVGPPLPVHFTTNGNALWRVDTVLPHTGVYDASNGNIGDNQASSLSLVLDYGVDGTFSFWHTGSTEASFDYLHFYVDGVQKFQIAGVWPWTYREVNVAAGVHTMKWEYTKDGSVSSGSDTVWIDDLEAIGGVP